MSLWGECRPKSELKLYYFLSLTSFSTIRSHCTNTTIIENKQKRILAIQRIGPHNYDIICVIFGTLLGDSYAEKRANSTRIHFSQESTNKEHLQALWTFFMERGYCSEKKPILQKRIGLNQSTRLFFRFKTFSYTSFNFIFDAFYKNVNGKNIKIIPKNIIDYLSPHALAVWLMDDGTWQGAGIRIATNSFSKNEVQFLCDILYSKYQIIATPVINGYHTNMPKIKENAQYNLYIQSKSVLTVRNLVKPYFVDSMLYKLGI